MARWLTVALFVGVSVAGAQEAPASEPASPAIPGNQGEQVSGGEAVVARATRLSNRVRGMLNQARKEADIIRITCLNDKLTQINANLRNAQGRVEVLRTAVDPERRNHEYTVLTVLNQKFAVLDQEANQCVGQDMFEVGTTKVTTEIDPDRIPEEEPSNPPTILPPSVPNIPPPASGRR